MRYEFPQNLTLDEVRQAVANANARAGLKVVVDADGTEREVSPKVFIEADRGDHVIFNYLIAFDGSFPFPNTGDPATDREYAILRECRGLTFSKTTGKVLNRKFAKFFNLGEKPETQPNVIDWSQPHSVVDKMDGSMITPLYLGDMEDINPEDIRWATKMGLTDVAKPVDEWVAAHPHYARWAAMNLYSGYTPLFEWCSRKQRIVVDYPEDRLVLLAIRNNATGEYLPRSALEAAQRSDIEIVRELPGSIENLEKFMEETRDLEGAEGYIIRFDSGLMLKVKGAWYCQIHRTKELLTLEKDVLSLIFEGRLDDAKAFMDDSDRSRVSAYEDAVMVEVTKSATRLKALADEGRRVTNGDKKLFATEYMKSLTLAENESTIIFRMFDGRDPEQCVRDILSKNIGTGPRIEGVRHLLGGLRWDDFKDPNSVSGED